MRLVVTGREGQVAKALAERAAMRPDIELLALGRPGFDLADPASVHASILAARPDLVVSAAAYTAVDRAEDEPALARAVNAGGAGAVAAAAAACGAPVIHLSTDYVFSGDKPGPYVEDDPTGPVNVYGETKLEGERLVAAANGRHLILRTAWVYSPFGRNFVKTMLALAASRDMVSVVADQRGCPTSALDIADAVLHLARRLLDGDGFGTFHLAGTGETSWAGFAREIFAASRARGGPAADVRDIATAEFPTRARRPKNSVLDTGRLAAVHGWSAPAWQQSCEAVVARLLS